MNVMQIENNDNVVVALEDGRVGDKFTVQNRDFRLTTDVHGGHKIAIAPILQGENVVKYGYPIGHATSDIGVGEWVHTHNTKTNLSDILEYTYEPEKANPASKIDYPAVTWQGYQRTNGDVGVRNDLYIVPTVGCINHTAQRIKDTFIQQLPQALEVFDNIIILKHPYGCSQLGKDHANTRDFLANAVLHPNAGAVLVIGLGCENNTIDVFKETLQEKAHQIAGASGQFEKRSDCELDQQRIKFLIAQEVEDEVQAGVQLLSELVEVAKNDIRTELPLSRLRIGLKCGGSDGFSGITANPLLGKLSDYVTQNGGTTILTEVPEMFGAETILMNRAKDVAVFDKVVKLINNFKQYCIDNTEVVYENPSPGNKAGGITTLEDKSLGCTQKAGTATVVDVVDYAQKVQAHGLNLLQSPGNDLVAASALAVASCHIVLFTTGRGNPYGTFVPTLKIASNSGLANKKTNWIDFSAGRLLTESESAVVPEFIELVLRTVSGQKAKNELNNYSEVAIFKTGITL
jgi:altronate hydrolase